MTIHQAKSPQKVAFSLTEGKWVEEQTSNPKTLTAEEVQTLIKKDQAEYTLWATNAPFQSTPIRVEILRDVLPQS